MTIAKDAIGTVTLPDNVFYGTSTARALAVFSSGDPFPKSFLLALYTIKSIAFESHRKLGLLQDESKLIKFALDKVFSIIQSPDDRKKHFPLSIWQSGSGTQTNMNMNEVIAEIANQHAGNSRGSKTPIHPNDHINKSQSSNDVIPTAIHLSAIEETTTKLLPAITLIVNTLDSLIARFKHIIRIGRTHHMDAIPTTYGYLFESYKTNILQSKKQIEVELEALFELPIGGTAVGTGYLAHPKFADTFIKILRSTTKNSNYSLASSKSALMSSHERIVSLSASLTSLSRNLLKISSDIRFLSSGPRAGIGEIDLPKNEPGSSIMPGKINPSLAESLTMIGIKVIGNHQTLSLSEFSSHLELNTSKPLIASTILESIDILSLGITAFSSKFLSKITPNVSQNNHNVLSSLMLATALSKEIGYDAASKLSLYAHEHGISLTEANKKLNLFEQKKIKSILDPKTMV